MNAKKHDWIRPGLSLICGFGVFWLGWGIEPLLSRTLPEVRYSEPVPAALPTKMRPWQYIVVHHSGSSYGNEESIQSDHLRRGMENGMAYHFLIGNGRAGLKDGEIVEGRRWKYQLQGGHSHQDFLNETGIGICFVGNFNRKAPTANQIESLAKLVLRLQRTFKIPDDRIHGHGQFFGEDSDCPGRHFSWSKVWIKINSMYEVQVVSNAEYLSGGGPVKID